MDDAHVEVAGLTKRYGDKTAISGVSFRIDAGESVALLGPNGAGKTTTIEILEGFRRATAGRVRVLGCDPDRAGPTWRARVGIVLQQTGTFDEATVGELLRQFAAYYPAPRDVAELIEAVGLTAQAGTRISRLSGGQRRRVDVALGVIGNPSILFLDEPTTGFDPEARREFWALIRAIRSRGTTILLTTHYLDEAAELSDRAIVIAAGTVLADSPLAQLGGPDAHKPHVRWTDPSGDHLEITADPGAVVTAIHARGNYSDLSVTTPSLEQTYLDVIDRARTGGVRQ
ncbi:ABC transporter ATP-binding protein [Rarobacter incanus]|nr:ABC transporter ATP-binding protein [Rarobacter incanus]